jgi:membrane protease YdiL (CAAX protease family)
MIPLKQFRPNRIVQIVYPLLVYFLVYQLGVSVLLEILGDKYGKLTCLLIAGIVCIIPILMIYNNVPKLIPAPIENAKQVIVYAIWAIVIIAVAILLNIGLTHSGLVETSSGFARANSILTDGDLLLKILCNCLVIPILEELLMRGIITGQLCLWYGPIPAVVISSICFGILHNNIVQFIYALVIGIGLGLMYVNTKRLSLCIITHCLINFIVIVFS